MGEMNLQYKLFLYCDELGQVSGNIVKPGVVSPAETAGGGSLRTKMNLRIDWVRNPHSDWRNGRDRLEP